MNKQAAFILSICILLFIKPQLFSQKILENIPDSLLINSHLIVLDDVFEFTIVDKRKTITEVSKNYIVLKKSEYSRNMIQIFFNEFIKVAKAKVIIYDKSNKRIKKYSHRKFLKQLLLQGSVSDDAGIEYLNIPDIEPPYRIEFKYKQKSNFSMFYPDWTPLNNEFQSVLRSTLIIYDKTKSNLRYKEYNISNPIVVDHKKYKKYTWTVRNIKPIKYEVFNSRLEDYLPEVLLGAREFEIDGFKGVMSDWKSIGKWVKRLNEGRNNFDNDQVEEIKSIVNVNDTKLEKVKKVYTYLQDNTRYASIQLGIGGWMPFESKFVHEKKYGDCKALTFYTKSMLDVLGIPSYYTLVRAGENASEVTRDFPSLGFNHAFLMVPIQKDTIWLECTSQTYPFGYLANFTDDRNVLIVKEDGGELIRSKKFSFKDNISNLNLDIELDDKGFAKVILKSKMKGLAIHKNHFFYFSQKRKEDQKEWLLDLFDIGGVEIEKFKVSPVTNTIIPKSSFEVEMRVPSFSTIVGSNMVIKPLIFNKIHFKKIINNYRSHDIYIRRGFTQEDVLKVHIPIGFDYYQNKKDFKLDTEFGKYTFSIVKDKRILLINRKLEVYGGKYDKNKFVDFKKFINTIIKKDNQKLVLEKHL